MVLEIAHYVAPNALRYAIIIIHIFFSPNVAPKNFFLGL